MEWPLPFAGSMHGRMELAGETGQRNAVSASLVADRSWQPTIKISICDTAFPSHQADTPMRCFDSHHGLARRSRSLRSRSRETIEM